MTDTTTVLLPYGYEINEPDVQDAKKYILRRESAAHRLSLLIDALLKDAADKITGICYRYGIDPERFTLTSKYNEEMFDEVVQVLDRLEDEIMDLVLDYATRCTQSKERRGELLPWLLLLGRGNRNLQQTLESRLKMFVKDLEAMIVAMSLSGYDIQKAVTKIKSNLHNVYSTPEMKAAFRKSTSIKATYIRSKGIKYGNVGNSNSEANNILRFGDITVQMGWMRNRLLDFTEKGAEGYVVMRGSNYPCDICQSHVGWHDISDVDGYPLYHGHCRCFAVPAYRKE